MEAEPGGAPSMGQPTDPEQRGRSRNDINVLGRELDIDPDDLDQALQGTPILAFNALHYAGKDKGSGPQVVFPDKVNRSGSVDGRLMQGNMQKLMNPNGSKSHAGPEITPLHLRRTGDPRASQNFSDLWLGPFAASSQQAGATGMPPGGAPVPPTPGAM